MRRLRTVLIIVLVLGGLLVGADRLALKLVEDRMTEELASAQNARSAEVHINGFPFLTQIASKELESVDARLTGVTRETGEGTLRVSEFTLSARNITLLDNFSRAIAGDASGTAHVTYEDLTEVAEEGVRVEYGGETDGDEAKVKVSAGVELLGQPVERSTVSTVTVEDGDTIRLRADSVPGEDIPGLENLIRQKIDYTRRIDGLPQGVQLEGLESTRTGLDVEFSGTDVDFSG